MNKARIKKLEKLRDELGKVLANHENGVMGTAEKFYAAGGTGGPLLSVPESPKKGGALTYADGIARAGEIAGEWSNKDIPADGYTRVGARRRGRLIQFDRNGNDYKQGWYDALDHLQDCLRAASIGSKGK